MAGNPFKRMWVDACGTSTPHDIMVAAEVDPCSRKVNIQVGKVILVVDMAVVTMGGKISVRLGDNEVRYPDVGVLQAAWGCKETVCAGQPVGSPPIETKRHDMCSRFLYEK